MAIKNIELRDVDSLVVRQLRQEDHDAADAILREAFDKFTGISNLFGDQDYVRNRFAAAPDGAIGAEIEGALVGSNFVTRWGSVGFFGPLSVRPDLWDQGVGNALMEATMDVLGMWDVRHAGLFTWPHSPKHLGLYQKYGFWPRYLTPVMSKPVGATVPSRAWSTYSRASVAERAELYEAAADLTSSVFPGLDVGSEIEIVAERGLGDTLFLTDDSGVVGLAVCHVGAGSEAGTGSCFVKFGAVRRGGEAEANFDALLDACEALAAELGATRLEIGVNTGRVGAYGRVLNRGFRTDLVGIAMHRPNEAGYSGPEHYVLDDWR